jgi:hypothetical protein
MMLPHRRSAPVAGLAFLATLAWTGCSGAVPPAPATPAPIAATTAPGTTAAAVTPLAVATTTLPPGLGVGDPTAKALVVAAMQAQLAAPAYRVEQTSIVGRDTATRVLEYVAPDRLHVIEEQVDSTTEMIVIGDTGWKNINGNWQPDDMAARNLRGALDTMGDPRVVNELATKIFDVQSEGPFELNGQGTHVYRYTTVTGIQGNPIQSTTRLWVRDSDGLPLKQEVQGTVGDIETTIVQLFTYDPAMRVEAPR